MVLVIQIIPEALDGEFVVKIGTKIIIAIAIPLIAYAMLLGMVAFAQYYWLGPGPKLEKFALSCMKGLGLGVLGTWWWLFFGGRRRKKTENLTEK